MDRSRLATPEELIPHMRVIMLLHECKTYCAGEELVLSCIRSEEKTLPEQTAAIEALLRDVLGKNAPERLACDFDKEGERVFYFVTTPAYSGRLGHPLIYFIPPALCSAKLFDFVEKVEAEGGPKELLHWMFSLVDDTTKGGGFRLLFLSQKGSILNAYWLIIKKLLKVWSFGKRLYSEPC